MMSYILFSPVGTSDPISEHHDGAILHICRKYKPKKVYLYLSGEMLSLHEKDNRFCDSLERLGKHLSHTFEVYCITRPNLFDVHLFDIFYNEFEEEIAKIKNENPEDTILLNVSSGTPAMKSSLQFLAALSDGTCIPIQVASPNNKSNPRRDDIQKYDKELYWEFDEDNSDNYVDRCSISSYLNLMEKIKTEMIKRHIDVYDYFAALTIAKSLNTMNKQALRLLELAANRMLLKHSEVDKLRTYFDESIIPVVSSNTRKIVEYVLWMDVKLKRKEYVDFIRGMTPIVQRILDLYAVEQLGINLKEYCNKRKTSYGNEVLMLSRNTMAATEEGRKLLEVLDKSFCPYKDSFYSAAQLTVIISAFSKDKMIVQKVNLLRKAEESVRNLAAHEIVYMDDDFIKKHCQYSSKQILDAIKYLTTKVVPSMPKRTWDSYDDMNNLIKSFCNAYMLK